MNHHGQNQAQRVDRQVTLAAGDFLASVIAAFFSSFSRANRLAIDDGHRGGRFLARCFPRFFPQSVVNASPCAVVSPPTKHAIDGAPIGKKLRQHSPLTTCPHHIQNRVEDSPSINRTATQPGRLGQQLPKGLPLPVGLITGILNLGSHATAHSEWFVPKGGAVAVLAYSGNFKTRS